MVLLGVVLILLAAGAGVLLFLGTAQITDTVDITMPGGTLSLPPLTLLITGMVLISVFWLGWAMLRGGLRRGKRRRVEAKEAAAAAEARRVEDERRMQEEFAARERELADERRRREEETAALRAQQDRTHADAPTEATRVERNHPDPVGDDRQVTTPDGPGPARRGPTPRPAATPPATEDISEAGRGPRHASGLTHHHPRPCPGRRLRQATGPPARPRSGAGDPGLDRTVGEGAATSEHTAVRLRHLAGRGTVDALPVQQRARRGKRRQVCRCPSPVHVAHDTDDGKARPEDDDQHAQRANGQHGGAPPVPAHGGASSRATAVARGAGTAPSGRRSAGTGAVTMTVTRSRVASTPTRDPRGAAARTSSSA